MRKLSKDVKDAGFRSRFEMHIAEFLDKQGVSYEYEPCKIKYTIPKSYHTYTPDWKIGEIYFESKGKFTAIDRKKILQVRESNPGIDIRLIFQNADVKLRKNSPTSYGKWATKNNFIWYDFRYDKEKLIAYSL